MNPRLDRRSLGATDEVSAGVDHSLPNGLELERAKVSSQGMAVQFQDWLEGVLEVVLFG